MGTAMEPTPVDLDEGHTLTKLPRPLPGGSYTVESLGRWIDRLMGDGRIRREAALRLEPLLVDETEMDPDPEPAQIPEPVPEGTEPISSGEGPPAERR